MSPAYGKIDGVSIRDLRRIRDDRGWLMEIFRSDWPEFQKFGQTYMTTCKPGVIKAWHYHKLQWDHFVPIKGDALIGLYDSREDSPTKGVLQEVEVSEPAGAPVFASHLGLPALWGCFARKPIHGELVAAVCPPAKDPY